MAEAAKTGEPGGYNNGALFWIHQWGCDGFGWGMPRCGPRRRERTM
jgi:hypothetical protein